MNEENVVTDWDVASRTWVEEITGMTDFMVHQASRMCISCGAHTNENGNLPCGH